MQTASKIKNPTTLSDAPSRSAFSRCGAGRITRNGGLRKRPAPKSPTLYLSHSVILYVPAPPPPRRMNYVFMIIDLYKAVQQKRFIEFYVQSAK